MEDPIVDADGGTGNCRYGDADLIDLSCDFGEMAAAAEGGEAGPPPAAPGTDVSGADFDPDATSDSYVPESLADFLAQAEDRLRGMTEEIREADSNGSGGPGPDAN